MQGILTFNKMEKFYLQEDVYQTPLSEQEYNLAQQLIQEGKQVLRNEVCRNNREQVVKL